MADVAVDLEWENLDEAFAELERDLTAVARGITIEAWNLVLKQTPQFYGRAAASWTYSINEPVFMDRSRLVEPSSNTGHYRTDPDEGDVFTGRSKGDPEAIGIANLGSMGNETSFRLGDTIYFANGVDHGEGPYAADLESVSIFLRSVNQPGRMVSRAFDKVSIRYQNGTSNAQAAVLKQLKIGG